MTIACFKDFIYEILWKVVYGHGDRRVPIHPGVIGLKRLAYVINNMLELFQKSQRKLKQGTLYKVC